VEFEKIFDFLKQFGMPILFGIIYIISQIFSAKKRQDSNEYDRNNENDELEEFKRQAKEQLEKYLANKKQKETGTEQTRLESRNLSEVKTPPPMPDVSSQNHAMIQMEKMRQQIEDTKRRAAELKKKVKKDSEKEYALTIQNSENRIKPNFRRGSLKKAIVTAEILGKPVALKRDHLATY
jgi:chromatin segregation and condensation protein Rec8/ScpA/Scc1 (kleisin family)